MNLLNIYIGCTAVLLSACSIKPYKLHTADSGVAISVISSDCNDSCREAIQQKYGFVAGSNFVDFGKPTISSASLFAVDGVKGKGSAFVSDCSGYRYEAGQYNRRWGGDFLVELSPGTHRFLLYPADCRLNRPVKFEFSEHLLSGHQYALAQVIFYEGPESIHHRKWYPVIYDYTTKTIVYGKEQSGVLKANE